MFEVILAVAALALIGIDHLTKYLAVRFLMPLDTFPIIQGVLHLTYAENTGAAFSMFRGQAWLLSGVTAVVLALLAVVIVKKMFPARLSMIALTMIFAGGVSNLIDRVFRHYVVDFIDFRLINFAIFNFADMCVSIGCALFILSLLIIETKKRGQKKTAAKS